MARKKNKKEDHKFSLTVYTLIVLAVIFTEFMNYKRGKFEHSDFFSLTIGGVGWFAMSMNSQRIINNNLFGQYALIALAIIVVCVIKQALTMYDELALGMATLPLLFIGFFRLLTFLFFRYYPTIGKKPVILLFTKTGMFRLDGSHDGYQPNLKERIFSLLLSVGFISFAISTIWILRNVF